MYADSVRVPLIVSGPGFPSRERSSTPVSLLDVQATMFHATGAARPAHWWGTPLQHIPVNNRDRVTLSEYHGHGTRAGSFMIRKGPWKLLMHEDAPDQLFNLDTDPDELVNAFRDRPDVATELEGELRTRCTPEVEFQRASAHERYQLERLRIADA
jgi:choline-sulfatase